MVDRGRPPLHAYFSSRVKAPSDSRDGLYGFAGGGALRFSVCNEPGLVFPPPCLSDGAAALFPFLPSITVGVDCQQSTGIAVYFVTYYFPCLPPDFLGAIKSGGGGHILSCASAAVSPPNSICLPRGSATVSTPVLSS